MNKVKFAFWGPPHSGKSWLIEAFAQCMKHLNLGFSEVHSGLKIIVTDETGRKIRPQLPLPPPSEGLKVDRYFLERELLNISQKSFLAKINSHQHEIILFDNSGKNLLPEANPSRSQGKQNEFDAAQAILEDATCIMLALDKGTITSDQYVKDIENLLFLLEKKPRYIAACITKGDEIGLFETPDAILINRFGLENARRIRSLLTEDFPYDGHTVEFFTVSSVGYIRDKKGQYMPNVKNEHNDVSSLADASCWHPVNVEKPFFWLLHNVEQKQINVLQQEKLKIYQLLFRYIAEKKYWTYEQIMTEMPTRLICSDGFVIHAIDPNAIIRIDKLIEQPEKSHLYENMHKLFSIEEIEVVCFHLNIDPAELRHDVKNTFIIDLILYCHRRDRVEELRNVVERLRPNLTI